MKITGGKYRGKIIEASSGPGVRPTKGMIREAMFNILRHGRFLKNEDFVRDKNNSLIEGRYVVDIFCGTGALGLEALSRGAAHVTLVDQNARALAVARQNVAHLREEIRVEIIRSDSTRLPPARQMCMLAFLDPPYNQGLAAKGLASLRDNGWLAHGAVVVVEHAKQEDIVAPGGFHVLDERRHDKTRVTMLQYRKENL